MPSVAPVATAPSSLPGRYLDLVQLLRGFRFSSAAAARRVIASPVSGECHRSKRFLTGCLSTLAGGLFIVALAPAGASTLATTTTLAITSGGSAVTSITPGTVVTLTATVVAGSTPVTPGMVNFCDATAARCEDIHIVGTAQLTSGGTAVYKFRPGVGSHSYKAVFVGTKTYAGSSSSAAALSVPESSPIPTATQLVSTSVAINQYSLTATVAATEGMTAPPTGAVSFLDVSNGNAVLATADLTAGPLGWLTSVAMRGSTQGKVATADFNGDGIPDLAVTGSNTGTIFLGNGDGTFRQTAVSPPVPGDINSYIEDVVAGDFNGDGIPDLAFIFLSNVNLKTSSPASNAEILLGNGDGTFTWKVTYTLPSDNDSFYTLTAAVADFNQDGILDLAITGPGNGVMATLLGNGDGTFTGAAGNASTGNDPTGIAVADFNGDGIPDLAVPDVVANTMTILLGNGDGTFTPTGMSPATGGTPQGIVAADLNGDGFPDLAVPDQSGGVRIFIGKGDGTFTASNTAAPGALQGIAVADFNGDGIPDLAVGEYGSRNPTGGVVDVLLGNGDGTFTASAIYPQVSAPAYSLVAADFDGNGLPDLAIETANNLSIAMTYPAASVTETQAGISVIGAGSYWVDASYPGDSTHGPSVSNQVSVQTIPPTLTITASSANIKTGQPETITATLAPYTIDGHSTDGEGINFLNGSAFVGQSILAGGVATLTTTSLAAGSYSINAVYPGDSYLRFASSSATPVNVTEVSTNLTVSSSSASTVAGQPVTLTATLSPYAEHGDTTNGETIQFTLGPNQSSAALIGTGTLSGGVATLTLSTLRVGNDQIWASYGGDAYFTPSTGMLLTPITVSTGPTTPTATTLAITSGGSTVTSITSGTVATLTATVVAGTTPVTTGLVNFCDAAAAHCTDIHILGTAQLTQGGTATYRFIPGAGSHSYKAVFMGTTGPAASTSGTAALNVTHTGLYATATTIAQSGSAGNYLITTTVGGTGSTAPTGVVSFLDASNGNTVLGTATLGAGEAGISLPQSANPVVGTWESFTVVSGDFNGDGIPDLAIANTDGDTITIFLGNGDGTLSPTAASPVSVGYSPYSLTVGDFNGDGKPDLFVSNYTDTGTTVLLGNGDGTFTKKTSSLQLNTYIHVVLAMGDFNGDGIPDLILSNYTPNNCCDIPNTVLLGNGDGTFTASATETAGSSPALFPTSLYAVGDFNRDGILDLAFVGPDDATLTILLGNGDGTFSPITVKPPTGGAASAALVAGDFNGDGILDLAVADSGNILLGNGDGTFTPVPRGAQAGGDPVALAAGDFDGDGIADLAVANRISSGTVTIMLGNGDGTFRNVASPLIGAYPDFLEVADFNGDGISDLAVVSGYNNRLVSVFLTETETSSGTAIHIAATAGSGAHQVVASYPGDGIYAASTSLATTLTAAQGVPVVNVTASPNPTSNGSAMITATVTGSGLTPTGNVTFADGIKVLGQLALSGGTATLTLNNLSTGSHSITVIYAGDANYSALTSAVYLLSVNQATPAITWPTPAPITYGTALSASQLNASSAVAGSFSYSTSAGTVLSAGQHTLHTTFTPTDSTDYSIATASVTLTVNQATPAITWATPAAITYGTALSASQLNASSAVAGSFSYSSSAGTVLSAGQHTLHTTFAPTDSIDYSTATASVTLTVNQATPANTLISSANPAFILNPVTFTATISPGVGTPTGTVSFYDGATLLGPGSLTAGVATYLTSTLAAGTHTITAVYSGDSNFLTVTSSALTETIEDFTVNWSSGGSASVTASPGGTATFTLAMNPPTGSTFPGPVTFTVTGLPQGATATFSPPTIAAGSGPTNVTLTVNLPSQSATKPFGGPFRGGRLPISLGLILLPFARRLRRASRRFKRSFILLLGVAGLAATAGLTACGGSGGGGGGGSQSPQTYTLTVTATAGSLSHSTTVSLTVN